VQSLQLGFVFASVVRAGLGVLTDHLDGLTHVYEQVNVLGLPQVFTNQRQEVVFVRIHVHHVLAGLLGFRVDCLLSNDDKLGFTFACKEAEGLESFAAHAFVGVLQKVADGQHALVFEQVLLADVGHGDLLVEVDGAED